MKNQLEKLKRKYKDHARYEKGNTELLEIKDTIKQKLGTKAAKLKAYKKSHNRQQDFQK